MSYTYELWDGKESCGEYVSTNLINDKYIIFVDGTVNENGRKNGEERRDLVVPVIERMVFYDGINTHYRTVLDVRQKSQDQRDYIIAAGGGINEHTTKERKNNRHGFTRGDRNRSRAFTRGREI